MFVEQAVKSQLRRKSRGRAAAIVVGSIVALVAVGIGALYVFDPSRSSETPSSTSAASASAGAAAGCAIGATPTVNALLELQATKDFTKEGAASFVASFMQFGGYAPSFSSDDYVRVQGAVTTGDFSAILDTTGGLAGTFSNGRQHGISFADGRYYVEASTPAQTVISIVGFLTVDGEVSSAAGGNRGASGTFTVVPTDAGWKITAAVVGRRSDDIAKTGTAFVGGC